MTTNSEKSGKAGRVDVLSESAPERIWLQVDADGNESDRSEPLSKDDWSELTWHFDPIGGQEVEYIRFDLVAHLLEALTSISYASNAPNIRAIARAAIARAEGEES